MAPPAKGEAEPAPAPAGKGKSKLIIIAVAALVLLGGGGAGAWYFLLRPQPVAAKEDPAAKPPEHVVKVGTIVVNVAGTDGRRYLRTTLELGAKAKESKHLEELRAPLLDAAIGILGGKPLPELLDPEERDGLREELLERLNEVTGGHGISHVFLTEFVVQ